MFAAAVEAVVEAAVEAVVEAVVAAAAVQASADQPPTAATLRQVHKTQDILAVVATAAA